MKARLYAGSTLLGEAHLSGVQYGDASVGVLYPGARLTVALVREHPGPDDRPLFCSGLLETLAPTVPAR